MEQDEGMRKGTSLWNTTLEDIDTTLEDIKNISFPSKEELDKVFKDIKENKTDIHQSDPETEKLAKEIERLANCFKPQPEKFIFSKPEEEY